VRDRLRANSGDLATAFARHEAHDLPGMFVLGASTPSASASKALPSAQDVLRTLAKTGPTAVEYEKARAECWLKYRGKVRRKIVREATADNWLTMEIYKLMPPAKSVRA